MVGGGVREFGPSRARISFALAPERPWRGGGEEERRGERRGVEERGEEERGGEERRGGEGRGGEGKGSMPTGLLAQRNDITLRCMSL